MVSCCAMILTRTVVSNYFYNARKGIYTSESRKDSSYTQEKRSSKACKLKRYVEI